VQWKGLDLGDPPTWSRIPLSQVSMLDAANESDADAKFCYYRLVSVITGKRQRFFSFLKSNWIWRVPLQATYCRLIFHDMMKLRTLSLVKNRRVAWIISIHDCSLLSTLHSFPNEIRLSPRFRTRISRKPQLIERYTSGKSSLIFYRQQVETWAMSIWAVFDWADPGGTAIPGQPVAKVEQAPNTSPGYKNQFNIEVPI